MQSHPIRVLLIDDDEDDFIAVRDLLSDLSSIEFILKWVSEYGAALDAILSNEFDVCLLDYRIKERNGLELMQEAVRRGAMTPIVFLTGQGSYDPDLEAISRGAPVCLPKGELNAALLERAIRHAMERQRNKTGEPAKVDEELRKEVEELRQAEEALRESREFLEKIVNSTSDPIYVVDRQHRYVLANDALCALSGRKREDMIGRTDYDWFPKEQVDVFREKDELVFETGKENENEEEITDSNGTIRTAVTKKTLYTDKAGNKFIVGVMREISERKRAEGFARTRLALFEFSISHSLEELLQKTLDEVGALTNSPIGFYHFMENDQRTISLQAWSTQTTKKFCKAEGKGAHYPIDQAGVWVDCVRERRPVIHNDYSALPHRKGMPEGHAAVIRELVVPIMRSGRIVAILGVGNKPVNYTETDVEIVSYLADVAWEIAERKRAEEALRESEAKYRLISENTGDVIWQFDLDTDQFVYVSPSVRRLAGFTPEEILGQNMEAVLTPESMQYVSKRMPEVVTALNAGDEAVRVTKHELEQLRKDGSVVPIEVVTTLLQDAADRVDRIIGVTRDITEQRNTSEALRESETKYRTLFEVMTEGVALHEIAYDERGMAVDYRIISTNPAFEKHTGLKSEQVVGQPASKIYGLDNAPYLERYALVASSGEPDSFETYFPPMNRFFHISVTSPKPGTFVTVFENITERKQAEEALKESQQQLSDIIDFLPDATFVIDGEGKVIAWNRAMQDMMGISAAAMLGKGGYEYALPFYGERRPILIDLVFDTSEAVEAKYSILEKKGAMLSAETYIADLRGSEAYLFCTASALYDSRGNIIGAIESIRNVTERKLMEKAIAEAEAKYRDIFENSVTGIFQTSTEGRLLSVNATIAHILGYDSPEDMLNTLSNAGQLYVHPDRRSEMFRLIEEHGWVREFEVEYFRKDKSVIWVSLNIRAVRNSTGGIAYVEGTVRDITDGKFLRAQLEQAQKMEAIGTLAGGIAHDFNNILAPIIGYTELSLHMVSGDDRLSHNLEQVLLSANRAKDLVGQILTFSRKAKQERKPVQASLLLNETIKLLRSSLPSTIDIRQFLHPDAVESTTTADSTQIHQVLMNLCTNAAHAMRAKGGTLSISLHNVKIGVKGGGGTPDMEPGPYLKLSVSDTGHGMDEAVRQRIFDPYYTTKGPDEGTGLGLAVVYGIVKSLSGAIAVSSKPGQGATFDVYLPRVKTIQANAAELLESLPTGHGRVLVVDDEKSIVDMVKEMLETLGYEAVPRYSSTDALEAFRARPESFGLVITDMTMPHMTGIDLAREILTIRPNTPIILCTGFSDTVDENNIKLLGIKELLMKPVSMHDLAVAARKILVQDHPPSCTTASNTLTKLISR
jgi:PAS domain S-box-containing protein